MKLNNEFVVSAPLEQTWATLLDVERVGNCLPGAQMEPADSEGVYRGRMKMKLGPMSMAYEGSARLVEVDEDDRISVMDVEGRDAKGQGTASATITNRLQEAEGGGTLVRVETDLNVTGRQAQFGRGIMEDVAGRMLGQFAQQLEQLIDEGEGAAAQAGANGGAAPQSGAPRASAPQPDDDVLDVGSVFGGTLMRNLPVVGGVAAVLLLLVVMARAARSPRRSFRLELEL